MPVVINELMDTIERLRKETGYFICEFWIPAFFNLNTLIHSFCLIASQYKNFLIIADIFDTANTWPQSANSILCSLEAVPLSIDQI